MLLVYFDCAELPVGDPIALYSDIVTTVLKFIGAQWPLMRFTGSLSKSHPKSRPVSENLTEFFAQFANFRGEMKPLPGKWPKTEPFATIGERVLQLGRELEKALSSTGTMHPWYSLVTQLPRRLANIFGFRKIYFVVDHFDSADITVQPTGIFANAPKTRPVVFIEYLKRMVASESFSLACRDEVHLLGCLEPFDQDGCDLRASAELVTVVDIIRKVDAAFEFEVILKDSKENVKFSAADCAGCPAYVKDWRKVVAAAHAAKDVRPAVDMANDAGEAARLRVLVALREIVPKVLVWQKPGTTEYTELKELVTDFRVTSSITREQRP
jgi:hypothetical protein